MKSFILFAAVLGIFGFVDAGPASAQSYFDWREDASDDAESRRVRGTDKAKIVVWMSPDIHQRFLSIGYDSARIGAAPGPRKAIVDGKLYEYDVSYGTGAVGNRTLQVIRLKRFTSPANFAGRWTSPANGVLTLTQTGTTISGTMTGLDGESWGRLRNRGGTVTGTVNGGTFQGTARDGVGNVSTYVVTLSPDGRTFSGTFRVDAGPLRGVAGQWTASRAP